MDYFIEKMTQSGKDKKSRVVLALDKTEEILGSITPETITEQAIQITGMVSAQIAAIKINYPLALASGIQVIKTLKAKFDTPIIADFKIADIDNSNKWIAKHAFNAGADAVITHLFTGFDSLQAVLEVAAEKKGGVIAVPNMSHPGASDFIRPVAKRLAKLAQKYKVSGVIAPATRPFEVTQMRDWIGEDILILCPGVGKQGGETGDAIRAGADFEIIGRSIYGSTNPVEAATKFQKATWTAQRDPQLLTRNGITQYIRSQQIGNVSTELMESNSLKFGDFTLASGKKSPYYVDLRMVPSHPDLFSKVIELYVSTIEANCKQIDAVAGIPTAGISFATAIAERLSLPLLYIRTKPKGHGRQRMVEGNIVPGQRVVLVDDLITDGGSKIPIIDRVRETGMIVDSVVVLLDRLQGGQQTLGEHDTKLHVAATILEVISELEGKQLISKTQKDVVERYIQNQN